MLKCVVRRQGKYACNSSSRVKEVGAKNIWKISGQNCANLPKAKTHRSENLNKSQEE